MNELATIEQAAAWLALIINVGMAALVVGVLVEIWIKIKP